MTLILFIFILQGIVIYFKIWSKFDKKNKYYLFDKF